MITISKEDYLKAIAEAEAEGQAVIPATLAHWLSVTRPAVTFASEAPHARTAWSPSGAMATFDSRRKAAKSLNAPLSAIT